MYRSTLAGHPLHPQLIAAPVGLFPFSLVMDIMYRRTGEQSYSDAAYHAMWGGYLSSMAAGVAGSLDYFSIPRETQTRNQAYIHGLLNLAIVGLYTINLGLRRGKRKPGVLSTALSIAGTAGLMVSTWFGRNLVYEHGMRVKGVDPLAQARDLTIPGDDRIAQGVERIGETLVPGVSLETPLPKTLTGSPDRLQD